MAQKSNEVYMINLLTEDTVGEQLNISLGSLRRWRLEKRGPRFIKVGSLVRYRQEDLEQWLASLPSGGTDVSTSQAEPTLTAASKAMRARS
jgi:excisionase family DNA binding protein